MQKNSIEIIDAELKLNNKRILNTSDKENIPFIKGIVLKMWIFHTIVHIL